MCFVSDFADQAVMLPLALVVLAGLGVIGWWRGAVAWAIAVGATFGAILFLKAGFLMLTADYGSDYRMSPSGHVASACVVYGGLAVVMLRDRCPRAAIAAIPVVLASVIGYTRLALGMHTVAEVVVGAAIGFAGVAVLAATVGPRPKTVTWPLPAATCALAVALHGWHLEAEEAIRYASTSW